MPVYKFPRIEVKDLKVKVASATYDLRIKADVYSLLMIISEAAFHPADHWLLMVLISSVLVLHKKSFTLALEQEKQHAQEI